MTFFFETLLAALFFAQDVLAGTISDCPAVLTDAFDTTVGFEARARVAAVSFLARDVVERVSETTVLSLREVAVGFLDSTAFGFGCSACANSSSSSSSLSTSSGTFFTIARLPLFVRGAGTTGGFDVLVDLDLVVLRTVTTSTSSSLESLSLGVWTVFGCGARRFGAFV